MISVSIISHGHGPMATLLLGDLSRQCAGEIEVLLTENIPESAPIDWSAATVPLTVLRNAAPRGFGYAYFSYRTWRFS